MGAEERMLVFSPWLERQAFFFCGFSLLEPFFLFFELRVRGTKAIASDVWSCVLLRFDSRFRSTPFSLSSSAKGEGEVARAEGEAEVALERLGAEETMLVLS